jgi:hypothetical protein
MQPLYQLRSLFLGASIGRAHGDIARSSYQILARLTPIAPAVRAIEHAQKHVTEGVYEAIRAINQVTAAAAISVLDILGSRPDDRVDDARTSVATRHPGDGTESLREGGALAGC